MIGCDECAEIYDGDPPCETDCDMPELLPVNIPSWELWGQLSQFERTQGFSAPSQVTMTSIANFCEMYDLGQDDFEKIMMIEKAMYPVIIKRIQDERGKE